MVERVGQRVAPAPKGSSLRRRIRRGLVVGGFLLVVVYAVMVLSAGGANLVSAAASIRLELLALPVLATFLSYVTMSLSYEGIARAAGSILRSRDMLRITFVANTANYVLPSGGLSGFALRMVMFTKKGISVGRSVLISFTQTLLTNLMLMVFIVYGLLHLMLTQRMETASIVASAVLVAGLTVFLGASLVMVYNREVRSRVLVWNLRVADKVLARSGYAERVGTRHERFFQHIDEGMEFFASRPRAMVGPLAWIFLDWLLTIGVLYTSFYVVGRPVAFSQVAVGFAVGIVLTIISFVPGGVGVLEGSMAAAFASMGIPLKDSVLPIFLFRISFYVIPAVLSLVLARGAFAEVTLDERVVEELL